MEGKRKKEEGYTESKESRRDGERKGKGQSNGKGSERKGRRQREPEEKEKLWKAKKKGKVRFDFTSYRLRK